MNQTATNIIQIPQENSFKVVKFELTPKAVAEMVKSYESLELIPGDKESYKTIHEAKMICVKARTGTDKHRKELGADARKWISDVNQAAQELIAPLLPLEEKLKAMLEEEDNREAKIAQEKADKIAGLMSDLEHHIKRGQTYNLSAETIKKCLDALEVFEISAVDFDTETERAESLKAEGLETLRRILADRERWESEQIEAEKVKAAQEAEAKRLADERAEFEAQRLAERKKQAEAQAKLDAEKKARDSELAAIAIQEAEKTRKANEELKARQDALDKLETTMKAKEEAAQAILDIKTAVANNWDTAHEENAIFDAGWDRAKEIDEQIRIEKLSADQARAELIAQDKKILVSMADNYDKHLSTATFPELKTKEAQKMALCLLGALKGTIHSFEESARDLV